jgi:hypothetical protein
MVQWKTLTLAIQVVLTRSGFDCPGDRMQIEIVDASDVTSHGLSYALIDFCPGGAYTDWIVAMQLHGGKPVPVRFRRANGEDIDLGFAQAHL